jgi:hypothetical protein
MSFFPDGVEFEWAGTGTGSVAAGAAATHRRAPPAAADGISSHYFIRHNALNEWERSTGTWDDGAQTMTRGEGPIIGSNGASLVNFSAGTKVVSWVASEEALSAIERKLTTLTEVKSGAYTAAAGELVALDSTGGTFDLTLPADPAHGARVGWIYYSPTWETDPVVLLRNGNLLDGVEDDVELDAGPHGEVVFDENLGDWRFEFVAAVHQVTSDSAIVPASLSAGAVTVDLDAGEYFSVTIDGAWNAAAPLIGTNPPPAGRTKTIQLVATISGSQTVVLDLPWLGEEPSLSTGNGAVIVLVATWEGNSLVDVVADNRA